MYDISKKARLYLFASIMSFCTSTAVSGITIYFSNNTVNNFFLSWAAAILKSWPLVFFLIVFFVPLINKFIDKFFITKSD